MLLWLWCKLAATAAIAPLAWEPPYAMGVALKKKRKKKKWWKVDRLGMLEHKEYCGIPGLFPCTIHPRLEEGGNEKIPTSTDKNSSASHQNLLTFYFF